MKRPLLWHGLLFILGAALLFYQLGSGALWDYDEAIYAQVIRETAQSGDILSFKFLGDYWFEKPPLHFWGAMLSARLFGYNEFALRWPAALAGLVSVALVMLIAWQLTRKHYAAWLAGAALLTTGAFVEAARQLRLDAPVTLAILFAFYAFLRGREKPIWLLGVGVAAALGVLLKSVIGLFVFPLILIWAFVHRDFAWLKKGHFWLGLAFGLLIALPWHAYQTVRFGAAFWNEYLFQQVLERAGRNILGGAFTNYQYLKYLGELTFPWAVVFLAGGIWLIAKLRGLQKELARPAVVFLIFPVLVLVVFLAAQTKLFYYLVPGLPFFAVFAALAADLIYLQYPRRKAALTVFLAAVLFLGVFNAWRVGFNREETLRINQAIADDERAIGRLMAGNSGVDTIYTSEYPYWDTIRYYSGGKKITTLETNQVLDRELYFVMRRELYDRIEFPPEISARLDIAYKGEAAMLLRFSP